MREWSRSQVAKRTSDGASCSSVYNDGGIKGPSTSVEYSNQRPKSLKPALITRSSNSARTRGGIFGWKLGYSCASVLLKVKSSSPPRTGSDFNFSKNISRDRFLLVSV